MADPSPTLPNAAAEKAAEQGMVRVRAKRAGWVYRGSSPRHVVEFFVCLALAVSLIKTFALEAYIVPTGSMAPTLLGLHADLTCPSCGFEFAVGRSAERAESQRDARASARVAYADAYCPNCGRDGLDVTEPPVCAGDRLLVNRWAYDDALPGRWEVIVFRNPNDPQVNFVKRVVGLPGEMIEIIDGDVYADGGIQRKTLQQQRAMRLLVYDNNYRPSADEPNWRPRWIAEREDTGWRAEGGGFIFVPEPGRSAAAETGSPDWLVYRHWLRRRGAGGSVPLPEELRGVELPERLIAVTLRAQGAIGREQYELLRAVAPPELAAEVEDLYHRSQNAEGAEVRVPLSRVPAAARPAGQSRAPQEYDWLAGLESVAGVRTEVALSSQSSLDEGVRERLLALVETEEARAAVERLYEVSHEAPIIDDYAYNGAAGGEANRVRDLFLECRVRLDARAGVVAARLTDGTDTFEFRASPASGEAALFRNDRCVQVALGDVFPVGREALLEMSMIDCRVTVAVDGRPVFEPFDYEPVVVTPSEGTSEGERDEPPTRPVRIGAAGVRLEVRDIRLYRDIYYTPSGQRSYTVGDDSFFVLGDNSPESQDSRRWSGFSTVPARLLMGRPFLVHYPSRAVEISILSSPRTIYVPNFGAIRYIR